MRERGGDGNEDRTDIDGDAARERGGIRALKGVGRCLYCVCEARGDAVVGRCSHGWKSRWSGQSCHGMTRDGVLRSAGAPRGKESSWRPIWQLGGGQRVGGEAVGGVFLESSVDEITRRVNAYRGTEPARLGALYAAPEPTDLLRGASFAPAKSQF